MEASGANSDAHRGSSASTSTSTSTSTSDHHHRHNHHHFRRNNGNNHFSASNFLRSPVSALLEYTGILQMLNTSDSESLEGFINGGQHTQNDSSGSGDDSGEVSIRIGDVGGGGGSVSRSSTVEQNEALVEPVSRGTQGDSMSDGGDGINNGRDSPYQRYNIQLAARWAEQILPFLLLLLVVFVRQHLQGFFVVIWISAFMFKSNDILRKQTALKGERKISVLISISLLFILHVAGVYWWYRKDDVMYPLVMLPPKTIPPFWHAIFIIIVNDTLAKQAAMVLKCFLLMYYKNSKGRNHRKQAQMLTMVEYLLLLYRALLPAPEWYRFFLNKEYGSLFSSLMTGLYLTFKLTSIVDKVRSFISALKALSCKEIHYGAYATSEQVNAAGDVCSICQENMHDPVVLLCKHVFCEECVSEWFERERRCPLCRASVRLADLRSFGDGSTSLFFQLF